MSSPLRWTLRRVLAVTSLAVLVPVLGACGFHEQTDLVYQPSVGVNDRSGQVDVLGGVVVSGIDGQGTLVASLSNKNQDDSDSLTSVAPVGSDSGLTTRLAAPVEIGPGQLVNLADKGAISVTGDTVAPGRFVRLELKFQSGEDLEMNLPVVDQSGYYSGIEPADPSASTAPSTPSASPTPAP